MKSLLLFSRLIITGAAGALLAGCLFKPTTVPTRSFVLTPMPSAERGAATGHLPLGIGLVKMPPYLLRTSMAVRKGTNEIDYMENALWAERLDTAFQRTLAANLSTLLPTDQIRLSAWQRGEVALAVYVNVEQFDVDVQGRGTLIAWWRIASPGGDKVLKSGMSRLNRNGPPPQAQPQTMAATLSELTTEFSGTLAQAIRQSGVSGVSGATGQ